MTYNEETWLKHEKIGIDIFNRKYRINGETFDEWLDRVSNHNEDVKQLILERKFLFGGRTLTNRNINDGGSRSNCYTSGRVDDSLADIMRTNTEIALTYKAQGGQGISLSNLRPKDTPVGNGKYQSDGIVPFMELFNQTTETVSQGGSRKGALILTLDAWHKQIEDFITIKATQGKITKANLSVEIDDEFMKIVEKDLRDGTETTVHRIAIYGKDNEHTVEYDIVPIKIFRLMAQYSWDNGEPAPIFMNRFRNYNIMEYCDDYTIDCCNPCGEQPLIKYGACVEKDTLITTPQGIVKVQDLDKNIHTHVLSSGNKFSKYLNVVNKGDKETYEITLSNGLKIKATADHLFQTDDGLKEVCQLTENDNCYVITNKSLPVYNDNDELYEMFGWLCGDGWICPSGAVGISFNNKDGDYPTKERLLPIFKKYFDCEYIKPQRDDEVSYQLQITDNANVIQKCRDLGIDLEKARDKQLPTQFYKWSLVQQLSFIRGLFEADGNIQGKSNSQVFLYSSSLLLIEQVQEFLSALGIHSTQYKSEFNNSNRKPQYKLCISKYSANLFMDMIGFNGHKKGEKFVKNTYKDTEKYQIKSIINKGYKTVYDILEVEKTNMFYANGILVHNCNLGSLNLSEFVKHPYTKKAEFDYESFSKAIEIAVQALDDVLSEGIPYHALEEQRMTAQNYRNIGLGIMGLGSMFFKMGIKYGSPKSKTLTEKIIKFMFRNAVISSALLAKQKGSFPKYTNKVWQSTIIQNAFTTDEISELMKFGLRNCSLLSIAPSGSIGTMLGITTGVEPAYLIHYQRKTESLYKGQDVMYDVYCTEAKEYMETTGDVTLPSYFIDSQSINWVDRVDIQAILQNYVDTAISSTVNLPQEITVDEIVNLYLYAWKQGIKGITIFRTGCKRAGILTSTEQKETEETATPVVPTNKHIATEDMIPWGTTIQIDNDVLGLKRQIKSGCGTFYLHAYFDKNDGRFLELFIDKGSKGGCERNLQGQSRLISLCARTGAGINTIVDQLTSVGQCTSYVMAKNTSKGTSCTNAIGYALLDMYNEMQDMLGLNYDDEDMYCDVDNEETAEPVTHEVEKKEVINPCPQCGEELLFMGGCQSCIHCGYSKCE